MAWERSIFIGDSHGDLVCHESERIVQDFMAEWKPRWRVHLGDVWDFRALRKKAEAEERAQGITYDYNCGLELLDWFKPTHLLLGNHDHRLWRASEETSNGVLADLCRKQADEAEDALRKRRIEWRAYNVGSYLRLPCGGPKLIHGYRATMYPAKAHFENWGECILGHVHKPDTYEARHVDGGRAMSLGCMADLDKLTYADQTPAKLAWRQGFAYGLHNTKTGAWQAWHVIKSEGQWISPQGIL
jgi:hypothetical protein